MHTKAETRFELDGFSFYILTTESDAHLQLWAWNLMFVEVSVFFHTHTHNIYIYTNVKRTKYTYVKVY